MATATVAGFRSQFPELDGLVHSNDAVEAALEEAGFIHGFRPLCQLLVAAHLLTLQARAAAVAADGGGHGEVTGAVKSDKAGPLTATYQTLASAGGMKGSSPAEQSYVAYWETTLYGQRFIVLERRTPRFAIGARVTGAPSLG